MLETSNVSMDTQERFYTYVLFSQRDKGLFIGYTTNLRNRLANHSNGNVKSTRNRLPVLLVHYEYFIHKTDAKAREAYLKSGYGRRQLKEILENTFMLLSFD